MAMATHKRLSEVDKEPYDNVRKMAALNMMKAEVFSDAGRIDEAKAALKKVVEWLEPIFEQLDKVEIIKACLLLFRIKVYFKDFQGAGQLMKFMDNYDTEGKLDQESEEFKVLSASQQALKKCYDDREEYAEDKLKTFFLPE
jgi:soluble cytochrome b562